MPKVTGTGGEDSGIDGAEDGESEAPSSEYRFYTEFQSHEAEFDYLKSMEIEEKINKIAWCKQGGVASSLLLLSTNDHTIKLWKLQERRLRQVGNMNVNTASGVGAGTGAASRFGGHLPVNSLHVPSITKGGVAVFASPKRVFANAHAYHINSIGLNSDGQTFLSADDLRINLWSLENAKVSYNIVDMKPPSLEELTEVITSAALHPSECHLFLYASSKGPTKLGDMRASALCDRHAKVYQVDEDLANKTYFCEIISSVSDVNFVNEPTGRHFVTRDYLTVKVWDTAMEREPVRVVPVHDAGVRARLPEVYESDSIFDRFEVAPAFAGTGSGGIALATGSYNNTFKVLDLATDTDTSIELSKGRPIAPVVQPLSTDTGLGGLDTTATFSGLDDPMMGVGLGMGGMSVDFTRRVLHQAWHPRENILAVAGQSNLYIYHT
jgi:serine/threonine-protein phosphatase 2A regulatory subunit B